VDRRAVSKDFKFETDPGRLVISGVANGTTLLQDGENDGGFVFDNQDSQPMTITGLTIDASFTALTTSSPLVLRFTDPKTGSSLFDYHLETAPTDPTAEYTESQVGISIPLSFTIAGNTSKMLPVEALGVHKWQLSGTSPAVQVVLRAAKLQQANIKTFFVSPQIVWMCAVPVGGYNPFATSSAFLNGEACVN
jgi:hypothetical protein